MATKKTHQSQTPSLNGTKPPRRLENAPADNTPKRAAASKRSKTAKAAKAPKTPRQAVTKTAPAEVTAEPKAKKLSALDAAAKVLAETGAPMNCLEMVQAMAAKGYWTSPGGQTPHATLYSAILREINRKGANARFKKTERGKFAHT